MSTVNLKYLGQKLLVKLPLEKYRNMPAFGHLRCTKARLTLFQILESSENYTYFLKKNS